MSNYVSVYDIHGKSIYVVYFMYLLNHNCPICAEGVCEEREC